MIRTRLNLETNWQLKQRNPEHSLAEDFGSGVWIPAKVPGDVYQSLLEAGRIPDPYYGLNELEVQWVAQADWLYRLGFEAGQLLEAPYIDLVLEGLDTFAQVWLNGEPILESDNMFVPQRIPVKGLLRPGSNEVHILFKSALRKGQELEAQHARRDSWNGDTSRVYVRKAQYHYGWDWGPTLLTAGPWKAVYLEAYPARIAQVHCPVEVSEDLRRAVLPVHIELEGQSEGLGVQLSLFDPSGAVVAQAQQEASPQLSQRFELHNPQLWWPNGYGEQPLYTLEARLMAGETVLDEQRLRLGMRRLRVVQEAVAGEVGSSFYFEVNHRPIFMGGANWIPDDLLLNRVTPERYRRRVEQAAQASLSMLRVWGGGIYEAEAFYDACDELGLLVWQDFMFACGVYPTHPAFLESVRQEAEAQVRRLRHRPSIALWCGNNEDYQIAETLGLYGPGHDPQRFEARAIYEHLLPQVCARLDPTRLYWPGSPYGGESAQDPTIGDRHTWDIWHGPMRPYQHYKQFEGRFVSEFGMQSFPSLEVLEASIPEPERFPQSRTVVHHNKAAGPDKLPDGHRRLAVYLADNLRDPVGLEGYVYATQFIQAEAMKYAYSAFRRRWGKAGARAVGGALVWQLNDCWPVTSWAIIDSHETPKPAYYAIKRELAPITLGLAQGQAGLGVWAVSAGPAVEADLELKAFSLEGEELASQRRTVRLEANQTSELGSWNPQTPQPAVYAARLLDRAKVQARASLWPEPFKYYHFPDPGLEITKVGPNQLRLEAKKPAKGVWLAAPGVAWSDNFLDLMPGEGRLIEAAGLEGKTLRVQWLDQEREVQMSL